VAVQGTARPLTTVEAPLSRETVIGYRLVVRVRSLARGWWVAIDDHHLHDFQIVDAEGSVRVLGEDPIVLAPPSPRAPERFLFHDLKRPEVEQLIKRHGLTTPELQLAAEVRCDEHLIRPGDPVVCIGLPGEHLDRSGAGVGFRQSLASTALTAPQDGRLIVARGNLDELRKSVKDRVNHELVDEGFTEVTVFY
jgi:hypothetical protein